ncbi:hypothetical protein CHARACLAT_033131 [Characodon lateralis]|uniref:Uncharacterized protein n=1 Tax=Characodon lateralis TaxID=208331 RepID=A0ABU7F8H2_9TELE|nr:hypothetical protein [Characodon lateralis]
MYTSFTSSTDIIVRHTILRFCQESIVYPEKNGPSGQEGSSLPCLPIAEILSIVLRDQLTRFIIREICKERLQKKTRHRAEAGQTGKDAGDRRKTSSSTESRNCFCVVVFFVSAVFFQSPSRQIIHTEPGFAGGFFLLKGSFLLHCRYMHAQYEGLLQSRRK